MVYGVIYIFCFKKNEKKEEGKAFQWKKKKRRKQIFLIYIYTYKKNIESGIVYIVYVEVAQAWYLGAAMNCELLDHEFSSSF